jgi:hypothetical protein
MKVINTEREYDDSVSMSPAHSPPCIKSSGDTGMQKRQYQQQPNKHSEA